MKLGWRTALILRSGRGVALASLVGFGWLMATSVGAVLSEALVPGPQLTLLLAVLSTLASGAMLVPIAFAFGWVAAVDELVREGGWAALQLVGRGVTSVIGPAIAVGVAAGALTLACTLVVGPLAARTARVALHDATEAPRWRPGVATRLGRVHLVAGATQGDRALDVLGQLDDLAVSARVASVRRTDRGPHLAFSGAQVVGDGFHLAVGRGELPLLGADRRVELDERSVAGLARVARATERSGGDASYEWAVLYKRWLHPLGAAVAPVCLLPFALGRRRWWALGTVVLGALVFTRLGDASASVLGPVLASAAGPLWIVAWGLVGWLYRAGR